MDDEVVIVRGSHFLHSDYLTAVNECFLEAMAANIPNRSSPRKVARFLSAMKTDKARAQLLEVVVLRMLDQHTPIPAAEAYSKYGLPIAEFP